jgi:AraC-like DNA-binding protein
VPVPDRTTESRATGGRESVKLDGETVGGSSSSGSSVLIRVEDEPPRTRLDYLRHTVADSIVPFDLRIDSDRDLRAQILTGRMGPVQLTRISAPPISACRTPRLIRVSDPELFKIDVQVRGNAVFAQDEREAALAPGDFTLVNLSRPCRLVERADEHEVVAVKFPRAALPLPHNELERLTAVPISGRDGLGVAISSLGRHIGRHLDEYDPIEGARLATALMDLLIVALAERLERRAMLAPATRRRALLASVQSFIDRRLGDPELSPSAIAAAHHISLRYLYKLFETQEATVAGWIRQRRLERCRRDLLDPALADRSVAAIAARWGLTSPAHFSRIFRAAYGLPPAEYRLTASAWTRR